jgi:hypothetical protein
LAELQPAQLGDDVLVALVLRGQNLNAVSQVRIPVIVGA